MKGVSAWEAFQWQLGSSKVDYLDTLNAAPERQARKLGQRNITPEVACPLTSLAWRILNRDYSQRIEIVL